MNDTKDTLAGLAAGRYTKCGSTVYLLSPRTVARVKRASKHASNNPNFWRSVVARPSTAIDFCERVEADVSL